MPFCLIFFRGGVHAFDDAHNDFMNISFCFHKKDKSYILMKYMPEPFRYTVHLQTYQVISNVVPSRIDWLHCWLLHILFSSILHHLHPLFYLVFPSISLPSVLSTNHPSLPFKYTLLPSLSLFFLCLVLSLSHPFIWLCNIRQAANSLYTSIRGEPSTHTHKPAMDCCLLAEGFVCYPAQTKRL